MSAETFRAVVVTLLSVVTVVSVVVGVLFVLTLIRVHELSQGLI